MRRKNYLLPCRDVCGHATVSVAGLLPLLPLLPLEYDDGPLQVDTDLIYGWISCDVDLLVYVCAVAGWDVSDVEKEHREDEL